MKPLNHTTITSPHQNITFNINDARAFGLNEAILLKQLHDKLVREEIKDSDKQTYYCCDTPEQWQTTLPFSLEEIRSALNSLYRQGIIKTRKVGGTNCYTISYKVWAQEEEPKPIVKTTPKPKTNNATKEQFQEVWDIYGYKVGKRDAEKAWERITKEEVEPIKQAVPTYLEWIKVKDFPQQGLGPWLNKRRWEDEYNEGKTSGKYDELLNNAITI